ncbi:MAG: bifunctional hydroxymethylpyrimidine kinase/phosphomethylpyrimidine kinase [Desulfobacterales bacterium]
MTQKYYRALSIAGSDSSGGAGIQADLKTFSALGCYGMTVITALTAQNTRGVMAIHAVPPDFVEKQLTAVLNDIGVDAIKIGMLFTADTIRTIAGVLKKKPFRNIVLDPVMAAQSGDRLLEDDAVSSLKSNLFPLADLITPNLPEAEILVGRRLKIPDDIEEALRDLNQNGCENILIKGGHIEAGDSSDWLYLGKEDRVVRFPGSRITTRNNHGTGCTLSSAIASFLARGKPLEDAVQSAKNYISDAIEAGSSYKIGKGNGPVHHFHKFW